jgi:hypothetical protein
MRDAVSKLIAGSYSAEEAQAFLGFSPSGENLRLLTAIGHEILTHIPPRPGGCALMSALWAFIARNRTALPVYVVAGRFAVGESVVFGKSKDMVSTAFDESEMDWDGHCWIAIGDYIGDISIFRTANSEKAPSVLRSATLQNFGGGRGLLLAKSEAIAVRSNNSSRLNFLRSIAARKTSHALETNAGLHHRQRQRRPVTQNRIPRHEGNLPHVE